MKTKFSNNNLLSSTVLVLNANYSPMTVCTAKRAISLYFLDKIDILSKYDESISSPSLSLELPSVIKIRTYVKNNNMAVEISRKNVLVRDNYECQYCGKKSKSLTYNLLQTLEKKATTKRGSPTTKKKHYRPSSSLSTRN